MSAQTFPLTFWSCAVARTFRKACSVVQSVTGIRTAQVDVEEVKQALGLEEVDVIQFAENMEEMLDVGVLMYTAQLSTDGATAELDMCPMRVKHLVHLDGVATAEGAAQLEVVQQHAGHEPPFLHGELEACDTSHQRCVCCVCYAHVGVLVNVPTETHTLVLGVTGAATAPTMQRRTHPPAQVRRAVTVVTPSRRRERTRRATTCRHMRVQVR